MPVVITRLTTVAQIHSAFTQFKQNLPRGEYDAKFKDIARPFEVTSLIGKRAYFYLKAESGGVVKGMALGWPIDAFTFWIAEIISSGDHAGSELANWFSDRDNVGMPTLNCLKLKAGDANLRDKVYKGPHYNFEPIKEGGLEMQRFVPPPLM